MELVLCYTESLLSGEILKSSSERLDISAQKDPLGLNRFQREKLRGF